MKNTILIIISFFFSAAVSATSWTVNSVEHGADGGFGYSGLHDASGSNVMSGPSLAAINSAIGTYNDVSGAIDFSFLLSNGDTLGLTGNLFFDVAGLLASHSTLAYTGLTLSGISATGSFGYMLGDVCCTGGFDPNSFKPTGTTDLNYLTLWGADGFNGGSYSGSTVGMDFRLGLTKSGLPGSGSVPEPTIIWMLMPALLGIFSMRRKLVNTTAA